MTLKVRNTVDFRGWILGWGENVEVQEPRSLRNQMKDILDSTRKLYKT
jgi:predicted DNA-binding transcriptional regulator YafY